MSRIIQQIATVQFQVDNRKVTASMNALQTEAESLNGKIAAVNQSIKALGDVPADNKFLLEYQKQLRQLNSDLKDVTAAQRDLMKGVKAADQLWKAAQTQNIESLSIKAIKAGQNGLRKRMENLRPELGGDDAKMYDAYKAVIDEADRVMNVFKSNYATVVQTIRDGGIVSEQAMKSTRDALRDLMESEKEGTAEHRQLAQQYDFLNESLNNVAEMRRREKGEIVNANDARREALKLTEDGIEAARRERDMADATIASMQQQKDNLDQQRKLHEDRIDQTEREIAANQRLEEAEQDRLADVEKAMHYNENEDRKEAIRLRKKADAARDEAETKKEAYEQQAEQEKLLRQHVKDTGDEVTNLTAKIEALGKTEAKPKVDTNEIERLTAELKEAERVLGNMEVLNKRDRNTIDTFTQKLEVLRPEHEKLDTLLRRKQEMDKAAIPFSTDNAKKSKPARFERFDNEQLRYAIESLSTRYNNLKGEEYFESLSPEKQIERVLDSAFHNIRPKLDYPEEYLKFFRDLGEALEYSGIKAKFLFEETEKGMKFKGVDFLEGYVSRRSEYAQLKRSFSEYGDEGMAKTLRTEKEAEIREAEIEIESAQGSLRAGEELVEEQKALVDSIKEKIKAQQQSTQADQQSVDVAKQKKELEGQLADATMNHTKAQKDFEAQQEKTNKAQEKAYKAQEESVALNEKAATAEEKVAHQEERHAEAMDQQSERLRQIRAEGQRLLTQYEQQKTEIQAVDKAWADADVKQGEAEARKAQNQELTIKSLDDSIRKLKEANAVIDTNSDEWEENTRIIQRLQAALDEMKNKPALMMMTDRMQDVSKLSTAAVTETRKFWEAMVAGAERGSKELAEYEGHLKTITEEEQKREAVVLKERADRLQNMDNYSVSEIREGIDAAKKMQDTFKLTDEEVKQLSEDIVAAETRISKVSVEAERQAQRQREAVELMESQLKNGANLTESALKAQVQYWQRLADDPKTAAEAVKQYTANMEQARALLDKSRESDIREKADRLQNMDNYSVSEIREGIDAAKKMQDTFKLTDEQVKQLSEDIVAAETRISKISVETERAARKEAQAIADMREQLNLGTSLTESALKAQENYWRRLADQPGQAADKVKEYSANMKEAQELQTQLVADRGAKTLERAQNGEFATANMANLSKAIKEIKEYQALIKDPDDAGKETFAQAKEQVDVLTARFNTLKGVAEKVKGSFKDADEVLARFGEHMNAGKTASEGMASALDERLSQATSVYDTQIEDAVKDVEDYKQQIREATQELADMEKELAELEAKHKNSSWFRKQTKEYKREAWRIEDLRDEIEGHEVKMDDGSTFRTGKKQLIEDMQGWKQSAQGWVDYYKKRKAEELGITEEVEEKKQDAQRLTQEQMQEGIKLLEEEYRKTDHTTAEGIKRREQLRQAIDQMNQGIKERTGEWMSLAQAEELASKAGTSGFFATGQQMQQATQAIERQRDALVKTIQQKQRDGEATKKEEEELQRMEKVLKDLKFEQDNFNMSHKQMEDLLKHPKKADDLDQLKAAIKRADGELHRMKQSLGDNNDQYRKFAAEVKAAKNELKMMEGQAKATTGQLEKAWGRLKTYVGLYMGFNMAWQKFTGTIGDMKELSDRMGEVGKTTQMAAGEIARMTTNLSKMDTRTALTSLVELSAKAGQLGLKSREDVEGFTEAANKMLVALPEMGADGATQMMKVALATGEVSRIQKQMDEGLMEGSSATAVAMEKIASTIDQLRANSAAAAPQITDFVKRVGAVGAQSGISIDQVAALGSTVDALGMRVEMSATALSRMIPAIKNNAFDVAKAIGMAPEALRKMFDEAGGGMNAMLAIFQHIKDQGMNANDIEKMLGMGGMQEIMKELNQQGARAGIVFAGLSQNVDVLREHLSIAGKAYEENIAIQQEYDRMNETTAAKWERLGNQIEEMFVGPGTQSVLGDIADGLRVIVDLVSGPLNTAFWATSAAVLSIKSGLTSLPEAGGKVLDYLRESAYKAGEALREAAEKGEEMSKTANGVEQAADAVSDIGDALENAQEAGEQAGEAVGAASGAITNMGGAARVSIFSINGLKMAWKGLDATMKANIIVAVIALLWTLGKALYDAMKATDAERDAVAKANQEADRAVEKLDNYFARLKETKEELDKVTKSTEDATDAEIKMTKAKENHRAAILNINKNYGQYLGFMLTEYDRAELVAAAHDKITAAIRREMLMKAKQAAIEDTGKEYEEGLTKDWSAFSEELVGGKHLSSEQAAEAKLALKKFLPKSFTVGSDGKTLVASNELKKSLGGLYNENASLNELTAVWFARHLQQNYGLGREAIKDITGIDYYKSDYGTTKGQYAWTKSRGWSNLRGDYLDEYFEMQQKNAKTGNLYNDDINAETKNIEEQSSTLVKELKTNVQAQIALLKTGNLTTKETEDAYGELARSLEGINENVSGLTAAEQKTTEDTIKKILEQNKAVIDSKRLQKARENIQKSFDAFNTFDTGDNEKNPWGSNQPAESTDWKNMTAEQLVNRRKQMKDFVNAIQTDTDVQSVLKEDAALKAAIEKGMSSDMRTVIEWYNTERLKIQDELHARHLTNTGDWMDPKKERGAKKQFRDEMDAYLHEMDAYYTERKTRIEEAGTDEGLTEAEIRNRTLNNEMEWQQRRAELQKLYSRKQKEVTQEELDAIYHIIAERTGDSESFVKAQIAKTNQFVDSIEKSGEKGAAIVHRWMSQVELDTERSYLKGQQALTKQMRAIEAIIDKERPFNGITKNLRESLSTMDILTGEMRKEYNELMKQGKDMTDFNNRQAQEEMKRTAFLLGEAENAYSTTIDRVMDDMRQKGMTAWADWLSADPKLQEALMAQLRSTYDAIQDAIKKEASQLKKQAEIMWNNILMPDGKTTLKQQTDRIVVQLGLDEGRVNRANSLIGAGQASERVADKLAIQQMKVQLAMQEHYYNLMKKQGQAHVDMLNAQAKAAKERGDEEEATRKTLDAQHAQMSLNLATSKEETELAKQREDIIARTEESQNRLYTELKSWADLLTSSLQGVFEASHTADREYYNERAKLDLTGKGGPGAGTYIVIDDEGTSDAKAHYEYLDERQALERQREIENDNAVAEAWKKMMDDLNQKLSDTITDQLNAMLQNESIDANTAALDTLTGAITNLQGTITMQGAQQAAQQAGNGNTTNPTIERIGYEDVTPSTEAPATTTSATGEQTSPFQPGVTPGISWTLTDEQMAAERAQLDQRVQMQQEAAEKVRIANEAAFHSAAKTESGTDKQMLTSSQQTFAKMTMAANMYGIAYQAMSNQNLSATQKFEMIALQAVGNFAISSLTAFMSKAVAEGAINTTTVLGKLWSQLGWAAAPVFAIFTGLLGAGMAAATSAVSKSKSQIAQATGSSVGAGRLSTGMLTYAEGNVNEFTDPASLTPGRSYNVDGADGKTYRAKYTGRNPRTHITNGPEFHLAGEAGREMIIDAGTTRQITMNEAEIWHAIKTLSGGGRLSHSQSRRSGMRAFADGNVEDFEEMGSDGIAAYGTGGGMDYAALQASLDRNSAVQEALLERLNQPIVAQNILTGPNGLPYVIEKMQKEAKRHGVKYL